MTNKCKKRRNLPQVTLSLSNKFKYLEEEDSFVGNINEENCTQTKNEKRRRKKLRKKKEERRMKMNTEEELKILGLTLRNDLKWRSNTKNMMKKAHSRLWIIKRLNKLGLT